MTVPGYHPEFGCLCPSPRVRQSIRLAMISAAVGVSIGAIIVLTLVDRRLADSRQSEQTSTFGLTDHASHAVAQATPLERDVAAAPLASEDKASAPITREGCEDEATSYLDPKCHLVRKHKAHTPRSMTTRLATVEIGRGGFTTDIAQPLPVTVNGWSTQAGAGPSEPAEKSSAPLTGASERASAATAKRARRIRQRSPDPNNNGINAFASTPPYAQDYRYGGMYRGKRQAVKGNRGWSW
jgi:hypothetical protein